MKVNKTYRSLLDKSIASMIAAIEIYNKPNFSYREDTFAILCINAWETLFKAVWLKENKYSLRSLYQMENIPKKNGGYSVRKRPKINRVGNPLTESLLSIIKKMVNMHIIDSRLEQHILSIIDIRDNAIHFINSDAITKHIQELGFATIKNYIIFLKSHNIEIDISNYNFYLMPLAYVSDKIDADAILTKEENRYLEMLKRRLIQHNNTSEYDIAISIDINFGKSKVVESIGVSYAKDGVPIVLKEDDYKRKYSLSYTDLCSKCRTRYVDFKMDKRFNSIMRDIKQNDKLAHVRSLDDDNPKAPKKTFYSTNIFKELDKYYHKNHENN